ncbi:germination protein [Sporosarcina luteola]|uniref:Germination protein n=1 Tax=Sporosarcina luteola TaxID=582850 RepID=A0A511Z8P9_9BACL|nr:Ger(x)C family spore germination protein [Sporosarcina luteola]GEN83793.1 germination protein [Sporosarcina luteola]
MKQFYFFVVLLVVSVGLGGCAETKILEEVGLTTLVGYDLAKEDGVESTAIIRQVGTELQSKVSIITAENATIQGTRAKVNRRAAEKLESGQLRGVLFGDEFAKKGIGHSIDTSLKNPAISEGMLLAVVEGDTKSLLEYEYPSIDEIGQHIHKLLDQNIKSEQVISSTLHEVSYDYYAVGRDIALPIIKRDEELVDISGIALFKKDKMVGTLLVDDSFYVKLSRDDYHNGTHELKVKGDELSSTLLKDPPDEISLVFDPIKTHRNLKLVDLKQPEFDMNISIQARILEIKDNINIGDAKSAEELEKAISKKLKSEISRVIAYCQEIGSDVFGYGEYYRSSVRNSELTEEKWREMYKEMKVNVNIDFTLIRSGVFE